MAAVAEFEDLFPHAKSAPALTEVYRQIRLRLTRLAEICRLVHSDQNDELLNPTPEYIQYIRSRWNQHLSNIPFRIDAMTSAEQVVQESQKARTWLFGIIDLQERLLEKAHFYRLFRSAIEKGETEKTDMENLYMTLTNLEVDDARRRLNVAFTMVLHFDFAEKYKDVLEKVEEVADRTGDQQLSGARAAAVRVRIMEKMHSIKVDTFACAVPLHALSSEDLACPICKNGYLDFFTFSIEDIIADYPIKIKYCGHVIGKSCLEMWMDTPLIDPAKYPNRTCPLCRTAIEGRNSPRVPQSLRSYVEMDEDAAKLIDEEGLDEEDCCDGILRLMSEEIAVQELAAQIKTRLIVNEDDKVRLEEAQGVLRDKMREVKEEKKMWGFGGKQAFWVKLRKARENSNDA